MRCDARLQGVFGAAGHADRVFGQPGLVEPGRRVCQQAQHFRDDFLRQRGTQPLQMRGNQGLYAALQPRAELVGLAGVQEAAADKWQPLVARCQHSGEVIDVEAGVVVDMAEDQFGHSLVVAAFHELIEGPRGGTPIQPLHFCVGNDRVPRRAAGRGERQHARQGGIQ